MLDVVRHVKDVIEGGGYGKDSNVVYVGKGLDAQFQTLTEALVWINAKIPSATNKFAILLGPGTYTENIIIPEYVSIVSERATITSSSGDTVTVAGTNCYLEKLFITSSSANPAHSALRVTSGTAGQSGSFFITIYPNGTDAATGLLIDNNVGGIYNFLIDVSAFSLNGTGVIIKDGSLLEWMAGNIGGKAKAVDMLGSSYGQFYSTLIMADVATGTCFTVDASSIYIGPGTNLTGFNFIKLTNAASARISGIWPYFAAGGKDFDIDATSTLTLGECGLNLSNSTLTGTLANGTTAWPQTGTTLLRPTLPASGAGYLYFDTDLGKTIVWNGLAWTDAIGGAI